MNGRSLLKPNELCSTNILNFLFLFHISSYDSFGVTRVNIISFCCLDRFHLGSIGRVARFNNGLRLFMVNPMVFLEKNLRRLLKICIQIKLICHMKRDLLASLVRNHLFRSLVTITGCVFLC